MLTSIVRASARRVLSHRFPTMAPQLILPVSALRPATSIRCFTASRWVLLASASKVTKGTSAKTAKKPAASAKKSSTSSKKKTTTKKKPVAKKAKKPKKPKKPKAKPAPKKKKVLTPEEKTKKEVRELKKTALLKEPTNLPARTWLVYVARELKKGGTTDLGTQVKEIAARFKHISDSELENLKSTAQSHELTNQKNYKAWVESHPVESIYLANQARRRLARLTSKSIRTIRDDRQPRRPISAYAAFVKARFSLLQTSSAVEGMRALSQEWKNLSDNERRAYAEKNAADAAKYQEELQALKEKAKAAKQAQKEAAKQAQKEAAA